jgi:hypothetical protein
VAAGISLLTAAALWITVIGVTGPTEYAATFGQLPPILLNSIGLLFYVLPVGISVSVILNALAGTRKGANRVVAVIGGILVLSPGAFLLVPLISSLGR